DAKGAQDGSPGRFPRSDLHRSALGHRHSEPDPRNRRQGRNHRARGAADHVPDREAYRPWRYCTAVIAGCQMCGALPFIYRLRPRLLFPIDVTCAVAKTKLRLWWDTRWAWGVVS